MPETFGSPQIDGKKQAAYDHERKGDPVTDACQFPVAGIPRQIDERGRKISAGRNAAQKEIANYPPAPSGIGNE